MQDSRGVVNEPSLVLFSGDRISIVVGNETHRGVLLYDKEFDRWSIRPDDGEDIIIAKV